MFAHGLEFLRVPDGPGESFCVVSYIDNWLAWQLYASR